MKRKLIYWLLAGFLVVRFFIFSLYIIPSGSMEPTLLVGDQFVVNDLSYGFHIPFTQTRLFSRDPLRGDVVVFWAPANAKEVWIKRVIGLPGDKIEVRQGIPVVNGQPVSESALGTFREEADGQRLTGKTFEEGLPGGVRHQIALSRPDNPFRNMRSTIIPAGHVFVMGDNRDNSADSRVPKVQGGVGMLPIGNLIGKAEMIVVSINQEKGSTSPFRSQRYAAWIK